MNKTYTSQMKKIAGWQAGGILRHKNTKTKGSYRR